MTTKTIMNSRYLPRVCSAASVLFFVWQPFPGEYRVGLFLLALLGLACLWSGRLSLPAKHRNTLLILLGCFLIPDLASVPSSIDPSETLEGIGSLLLSIPIGAAMLLGFSTENLRKLQQNSALVLVGAWCLIALTYSIYAVMKFGSIQPATSALSFFTSSRFGRLLTALLPMALWQPIRDRKPGSILLLIAAGLATVATGQRNNLLSYAIGASLLIIQLPKKTAYRILAIALASVLVTFPLSSELQVRVRQTAQGALSTNTPKNSEPSQLSLLDRINTITNERGYIYDASLKMFAANPATGIGASAFKEAYPLYADKRDSKRFNAPPGPHQIYLGILAQTGILGMAGMALAIGLLIRRWQHYQLNQLSLMQAQPYAASLAVLLFPLITQEDFYSGYFSSLFLYMVCGFFSAGLLTSTEKTQQTGLSNA